MRTTFLLIICIGILQAFPQNNWHWEIAPSYQGAGSFSEGLAAVKVNNFWGYINSRGEVVIEPQFDWVAPFSEGMAAVKIQGYWAYINTKGAILIEAQFDDAWQFKEGLARVKTGKKWAYIDKAGNKVISLSTDFVTRFLNDGETVPGDFSEGLAMTTKEGKWGYINMKGNFHISPRFNDALAFRQGLARVKRNEKWGFINKKGRFVIEPQYDEARDFREGLARVKMNGLWGYVNEAGEFVIETQYQNASSFNEGLAVVNEAGKWGYINPKGEFIIEPQYDAAGSFTEGFARIKIGEKWGFIDPTGEMLIKPEFDEVWYFQNRLARVRQGENWGFIKINDNHHIQNYVQNLIDTWKQRGKYEKSNDYQARLSPDNLKSKLGEFTQEAIEHFGKKWIDLNDVELIKYYPDNELFEVRISDNKVYFPVPLATAPKFEEDFEWVGFENPRYAFNEDKIILSYIEAKWSDTLFVHDQEENLARLAQSEPFDLRDLDLTVAGGADNGPNIRIPAEVDSNLPNTAMQNPDAVAVIIGNRNYEKTQKVDFALNDARVMRRYLTEVMGFREGNILYYEDASKANFEEIFGNSSSSKGRLYNTVRPEVSDVFVFYAGHGAPGLNNQKAYFVPVESDPQYIEQSGYELEMFYKNLSELPAKSLTVVLDACFSGENLFKNISPVRIRIRNQGLRNGTILSSSANDQVSGWYPEKQHGLFSYFFFKAIHEQNADKDENGQLTIREIYDFVSDNAYGVPYEARRQHGITQNPQLSGDEELILVTYK